MLALSLESRLSEWDELHLTAYVVHSQLDLFNDFTFQLRDKENFDEIEQTDARIDGAQCHLPSPGLSRERPDRHHPRSSDPRGLDDGGTLARQAADPAAHLRAGE